MGSYRTARTVGPGATINNLLTGENIEFVGQRPTVVRSWFAQDGVAADELVAEVSFGNVISGRSIAIPLVVNAGTGPFTNEAPTNEGLAMPGDRIQIKVVSTAAAATANLRAFISTTEV